MSFGLECWDAQGRKTLSITDRLSKRLGEGVLKVNIPAKVQLNTVVIENKHLLPETFLNSGLSIWVIPLTGIYPSQLGAAVTSVKFDHSVVGNVLTVSIKLTGYANFADSTECPYSYGAY